MINRINNSVLSDILPYPIWNVVLGPLVRWSGRKRLKHDLIQEFGKIPQVGDLVCDCRYKHLKIVKKLDLDEVELEDGANCSLVHCCSNPNHKWEHPNETRN